MLNRAAVWQAYVRSPKVQDALRVSNEEFAKMPDWESVLEARDFDWRSGDPAKSESLVEEIRSNSLSKDLTTTLAKLNETSGYPAFGEVFVTNAYGANVALSQRTTDYDQSDEEWWRVASKHSPYFGDVYLDESTEHDSVEICIKVDSDAGEFLGVLKAVMNINEIYRIVDAHALNLGASCSLGLLKSDGRIIKVNDITAAPRSSAREYLVGGETPMGRRVWLTTHVDGDGEELMTFVARAREVDATAGLGWVVVQQIESKAALAPIRKLR